MSKWLVTHRTHLPTAEEVAVGPALLPNLHRDQTTGHQSRPDRDPSRVLGRRRAVEGDSLVGAAEERAHTETSPRTEWLRVAEVEATMPVQPKEVRHA